MERVTLEPLRHEPAHPPRQLGLNRVRRRPRLELGEYASPGARHARPRASAPEPRQLRRNFGIASGDDRLEIVAPLSREKGRYFESFRIRCQRRSEHFLRRNRDLRREHQVPGRRQLESSQALANAFADGVAPKDEKRHVGPKLQADFAQPRRAEIDFPEAIEDQQDRRRVRRAPAEPPADGEVLFEPQLGPAPGARFTLQKPRRPDAEIYRSEEHTSELQSLAYLVCRLLLEKKKKKQKKYKK